jgi:hypothetical protein
MPITWQRAVQGLFTRSGELAEGTRYVRFAINGVPQIGREFKPDYAINVIEQGIAKNQLPADSYSIIEEVVDAPELIEARKGNLTKARKAKAAKAADENEEFTICPLCSGTGEHDAGCDNPAIVLKKEAL